jgi:NAD(P)-dependent dehydrogenase (short-subunit alcohol dehydrogenase family)
MSGILAGKTVLITGASRGIGAATAKLFVAQGARVALVARNLALLEQVAAPLGAAAIVVVGDTSDPSECARVVTEVSERLGPVDILVANAGILRRDFIEDISVTDFEETYRTNVGGALWLTQALIPGMRERGFGRLVLVSSELGLFGAPSYGAYCMSKFAMIGLAEVLSHELAGTGVRASAVCPGNVSTDQFAEEYAWGPSAGAPPEKALSPESVAVTIAKAAEGGALVMLSDTASMKLQLNAMFALPHRLRLALVRDAYKALMKDRRQRLSGGPA